MRVLLVGPPSERTLLRTQLAGTVFEIVGEFSSLSEARAARVSADAIVMSPGRVAVSAYEEPLTSREIEVLELVAEGLSNKAIAARLGISDQTVKFHVASLFGKLDAANRTEVVRKAIRRGLITI
jgi:DNA-binding CsgD family transcriptional regulator